MKKSGQHQVSVVGNNKNKLRRKRAMNKGDLIKEKTGLAERQIWEIVNRASKLGKVKKMKRGLYGAA